METKITSQPKKKRENKSKSAILITLEIKRRKKMKRVTRFSELEGIGGFIEEIGGVFVFGTEKSPSVQLLLCFLLEFLCSC
uniref:Alpha-soluble nsf attachment protein n=1 Tax=Rhizophora mucronata TaxID=61149 RepID=A0A2P2M715_RHIMU